LSGLLKSDYDAAAFTEPMQVFLKTATGKGLWKGIADRGALTSFTFSDREQKGDSEIYRYKVSLGGGSYWFSIRTRNDGKIAQIYWW
jgi:hypothetical protein